MALRRIRQYIMTRFWSSAQYPDPGYLYRRGGLPEVIRYLHVCPAPGLVRDILVRFGAHIDPATRAIGPWITIHPPRAESGVKGFGNLWIGSNVHVGAEVFLDLSDSIRIEDHVTVAMRTIILTHLNLGSPSPDKPLARIFPRKEAPTTLRHGCSVGAAAIIGCGVEIGAHAMVGAGVFVNRKVSPRTIVRSSRHLPDYVIPGRWIPGESDRAGADDPGDGNHNLVRHTENRHES